MSEWISVKERLPIDKSSPAVLVCVSMPSCKLILKARYFTHKGWKESPTNRRLTSVTHWMPLPEPPA